MLNFDGKEYTINGVNAVSLVEKYGSPLYVYDSSSIIAQYKQLSDAFSNANVKFKYACKALTNINVLKLMKKIGTGLDVVSVNEIRLGLKAGFSPEEIVFTPNCVSIDEFKEAVDLGVNINIDNISILEQFGHLYGDTVPVCIRINPHIFAGGNYKISTGHIDSKFGISIYQIAHVKRVVSSTGLKVKGLHMHTGSEILDVGVFLQGADVLFNVAKDFEDLEFLDLGSGFKVPYKPEDLQTDIALLGEKMTEKFNDFSKEYGRELEYWFEPGKFLVSKSGTFLTSANVIKQTPANVFVGINSGFNHLIRPMLYESYHHILNISNPNGVDRIYTIVGYICETDTFGWDRKLTEVKQGDIIAFKNAGAYCFEMSSNFNSRLRPAEVMVHESNDFIIRKAENFDELLRNQVEIDFDKVSKQD